MWCPAFNKLNLSLQASSVERVPENMSSFCVQSAFKIILNYDNKLCVQLHLKQILMFVLVKTCLHTLNLH